MALMRREHASMWRAGGALPAPQSSEAKAVHQALATRGALFFHELLAQTGLLPSLVERGLAELAAAGLASADSFAGLRALLAASRKTRRGQPSVQTAGRWALVSSGEESEDLEAKARVLLKRYGVVFRSLLARENGLPPWRELVRIYRRLEARGEIRGGRFASGFAGEQFAATDAVGRLRAVRRVEKTGEWVALSAADPLNLVGVLTPEARVAAIASNRVLFRDGAALAALEAGEVRRLAQCELPDDSLHALLARRSHRPLNPYLRAPTAREERLLAQRAESKRPLHL
jgi:ATP-dependent Lhr-like helicase